LSPFSPFDLSRIDPTPDRAFYALPRLVYHIDEPAAAALTQFYRITIPPGSDVLDVCSSWVSHYPAEFPSAMKSICGTGMNGFELRLNDQLTGGCKVADLNAGGAPVLPYPDGSFDAVTCALSIDYLVRPVQALREVRRVLRPGGVAIVSQSNRCFPTKAVRMWLGMNDRQRLELINGYFAGAGGFVDPRQAYDISADVPPGFGYRDPMFVVVAVKAP
jgi:SAM-dependent methyltransferase